MSYESKMLEELAMPTRKEVGQALLRALLRHGGAIKEFGAGQEIVDEIADDFGLNEIQRSVFLETVYRKENRRKKSLLWHRLLFRAADLLANEDMVSRPTKTLQLTYRKEWMLTEKGFDEAMRLLSIPIARKELLPIKSYEVQKIARKLIEAPRPEEYDPIDNAKKFARTTKESALRSRGFRQAVIEAYNFRCAICGLKINSPDSLSWEVEAAHIVPNGSRGRDDIFNGIALCRLHHWALDVGWFALLDDYRIQVSPKIRNLPLDCGRIGNYELLGELEAKHERVLLPDRSEIYPHQNSIRWHRENVFYCS